MSSDDAAGRPFLGDGDGKAHETVGPAADGDRAGLIGFGRGRRYRAGGPGPRARQSLVPRSAMGPGLGHQLPLGLEPMPRLARSGSGRLGAIGAASAVSAAAAASTGMGSAGSLDVEPD